MSPSLDMLAAPEGAYLTTYSYLLPPPPAHTLNLVTATLQGTSMKEAANSAASASLGSASGSAAALAAGAAAATTPNDAAAIEIPQANAEGIVDRTALYHISIQAPSAWSHVPLVPTSKISVASIRYPQGASRRDRQQSSYMSASDVMEDTNGSDTSLSNTEAGMIGSGHQECVGTPTLGPIMEAAMAAQGIDGQASQVTGGQGGLPGMAALQILAHLGGGRPPLSATSVLTAGVPLNGNGANTSKNLLKPKNNLKQTSSSFVQRLQNHNDFAKLFGQRPDGNSLERFVFVSRGKILYWLGETANGWIKDPLARLTFASSITSHDINQHTRSPTRLDVAIAFTTSDIIWFEAISARYSRLNKAGCVNDAPITNIRWIPGSENLLLTSHSDGTCTIFEISREDSTAGSWTPASGMTYQREGVDGSTYEEEETEEVMLAESSDTSAEQNRLAMPPNWKPPIKTWDPTHRMLVTRPALLEATGDHTANKQKGWGKMNPVAHWRLARSCMITDIAFSPDHTKLAVVSTDGLLRIINLLTETLEGSFESYYGALNKVVFSPDAKFLLTAGCDDLVSVWTSDGRLLSRCPGHTSFVTGLAFDPWRWKVEDKTYRFASVGEDGKIFLWDFSSAALVRPKTPHSSSSFQRRSSQQGGSAFSASQEQSQRRNSGFRRPSLSADAVDGNSAIFHKAPPRNEVAELQPVASYQIGGTVVVEPLQGPAASPASLASGTAASGGSSTAAGPAGMGGASAVTSGAPTTSTNHGSAVGAINPAAVASTSNELGSTNDLLVDVRFRPDGLLVMHRSGTLRFLQRPRQRNISRSLPARTMGQ